MADLQKDLLRMRSSIVEIMRAQLMGPGSEISYPDADHELISEAPSDRYSVGILYPQNQKFGYNDYESNAQPADDDVNTADDETQDETEGKKTFSVFKEDSFDDEVNLAQQNKPSSMGLSFFISGDILTFEVLVMYAKYAPAKEGDIEIPYSGKELTIPTCLTPYISFNEKNKTIKKLQSIKWNDLNDLFEQNAIEDAELLHLIGNLNTVFKSGRAYRRSPYEEKVCLRFDGNMAKTELVNAKAYVTAVKHKVSDDVYGITIMLVNNETIGAGYIFQPKIIVKSEDLAGNKFVPYNNFSRGPISEEELSLDLLYRKKKVYGTGHGVAVDWKIEDGQGRIFTADL